ncbi:hypothetical protein V7S43_014584 [Phytophthora oleae]|uniref:GPI inositol-deacylase n=1 Tax=Phytophthora oleae TaxID=2107226 RepID=A0ABD3F443_9STRA
MVASTRILAASTVALLGLTQPAAAVKDLTIQKSLNDAPSVRLHITFKRKSMKLHGQSEFDIYASPVVSDIGDSVRYNSYATFHDEASEFTYTVVDGSAYLTMTDASDAETVRCIPSNTLPFDKILPALNAASPIPSASIGDKSVKCDSGNLFKTTFAGAHYAICAEGEAGLTAYSSDLDIAVEYLNGPVSIEKPALTGQSTCEIVQKPTSLTPTALALATGGEIPSSTSRKLKEEVHLAMQATQCQCLSTPRPCVFFHGNGNRNEMEELQDTPKNTNNRMGNMNDHAPCCTEVKYAVLNTVDYSWTNDSLQQKFCDRALRLGDSSNQQLGVIKDTVIITHSMAGLITSMALATGKCSFGEGASWVAISSPMKGTMAADFLKDSWEDEYPLLHGIFDFLSKCPVPKSRLALVYQNGENSNRKLNAAYTLVQEAYRGNVTYAMCSNDYVGLVSKYLASLTVAGTVLPHKSFENDGLIEYQSCAVGLDDSLFGTSYKDEFYKPELNHADTVFLDGDGIFKNSQKPVKWFECLF